MTPLSLREVATRSGGVADASPDTVVARVSTDTRSLQAGELFIALHGDRFDAHDHLADARHAAAAVVHRVPPDAPGDLPLIIVPDTRRALGDLAAWHRTTLRGPIVAIAGSNGKTSTKLLVDSVLRTRFHGTASPRSFNNDIGVPLTLLDADAADDYTILEIGTNHPGEIERLIEIAQPTVAVVTSIGREHLEGFGDLDGVRRENLDALRADSCQAIVCGDDGVFKRMAAEVVPTLTTFGLDPTNDLVVRRPNVSCEATSFTCSGREWNVSHLGLHAASNAAAAIAVGRWFGMSDDDIAAGLASADVPAMRINARRLPNGVLLLDDSYNANPESMKAALAYLADLPCAGRRIAVLGDMLEMGDASAACHVEVLDQAMAVCDMTITVGDCFVGGDFVAADADDAVGIVQSLLSSGDIVLIKASRGIGLDQVAAALASPTAVAA